MGKTEPGAEPAQKHLPWENGPCLPAERSDLSTIKATGGGERSALEQALASAFSGQTGPSEGTPRRHGQRAFSVAGDS